MKRANIQLQAFPPGLVNKTLHEKQNSVHSEDFLLWKIEEATPSCWQVKKMTEAMLDDQEFIAPVAKIAKKETKEDVNAGTERKDWHRKFLEVAYSPGVRSASSSGRPSRHISDDKFNKNA